MFPGLILGALILAVMAFSGMKIGEERYLSEVVETVSSLENRQKGQVRNYDILSRELIRKMGETLTRRLRYSDEIPETLDLQEFQDAFSHSSRQASLLPIRKARQELETSLPELDREIIGVQVFNYEAPLKWFYGGRNPHYNLIYELVQPVDPEGVPGFASFVLRDISVMLLNYVHMPEAKLIRETLKTSFDFDPNRDEGKPLSIRFYSESLRFLFYRVGLDPVMSKAQQTMFFPEGKAKNELAASALVMMVLREGEWARRRFRSAISASGGHLLPLLEDAKSLKVPAGFESFSPQEIQRLMLGEKLLKHCEGPDGQVWLVAAFQDNYLRENVWWFARPLDEVRLFELRRPLSLILIAFGLLMALFLFLGQLSLNLSSPLSRLAHHIAYQARTLQSASYESLERLDLRGSFLETQIMQKQLFIALEKAQKRLDLMRLLGDLRSASAVLDGHTFESEARRIYARAFGPLADLPEAESFRSRDTERLAFDEEILWHRQRSGLEQEYARNVAEERELTLAQSVQNSLLPKNPAAPKGFEAEALFEPARYLGGDFYDSFTVKDVTWQLVADVSGKGLAAALYGSLAKAAIRALAFRGLGPEEILAEANRILCERGEEDFFCTLFIVRLEADGAMQWASAGHNRMLLKTRSNELVELNGKGLPLGIFPKGEWIGGRRRILEGESLILYTDGIPEAENLQKELYGFARFFKEIEILPQGAEPSVRHLLEKVKSFVGGAAHSDDWTLLVVHRRAGFKETGIDSETV